MVVAWGFAAFHAFGAFKPGRARKIFFYSWLAFMVLGAIVWGLARIGEHWGGMTNPVRL